MIAVDTNVLLRYLLLDDHLQAKKAHKLITGSTTVLVSNVVLVETLWTLCGSKYRITQDDVVATIQTLFAEPNIVFEHAQTIWRALGDYIDTNEDGKRQIDFPDALILNIGRRTSQLLEEEFEGFYTFDKAAQKLPETLSP